MTKIEVLQSKNSQQAKIDVAIDKLVSYIKDYTKHELEDVLDNEEQSSDNESDCIVSYTDICNSIKHQMNYNEDNSCQDEQDAQHDSVNHPSYYADGNIEVIDYIEDKNLGYHLGTAIKYISRAGKKREQGMTDKEKEIQDLQKAVWFINRKIEQLQKDE